MEGWLGGNWGGGGGGGGGGNIVEGQLGSGRKVEVLSAPASRY